MKLDERSIDRHIRDMHDHRSDEARLRDGGAVVHCRGRGLGGVLWSLRVGGVLLRLCWQWLMQKVGAQFGRWGVHLTFWQIDADIRGGASRKHTEDAIQQLERLSAMTVRLECSAVRSRFHIRRAWRALITGELGDRLTVIKGGSR